MTYTRPDVVSFEQATDTTCGSATSATGPFYCPPDQTVYLDLGFFDDLQTRFGASGGALAEELWVGHASTTVDPDTGVPFLATITPAELADALSAASAVGDDRIQRSATGTVDAEAWTHGSSEQRQRWFSLGYDGASLQGCNALEADTL